MNATEKLQMQVSEEQDGSAVVKMDEKDLPPAAEDDNAASAAAGQDDRGDDERESASADADDNDDDDRERIREARREERKLKKQIHREKANESNNLINVLRKQNEQMAERLAQLEKRTEGADMARLDKAIEDAQLRLQYAKMKIASATQEGNGQALADAQESWYEARRQVESLQAMKKQAVSAPKQQAVPKAPDPRLQRYASEWIERNPWYNPNGRDVDSKIAMQIDSALSEEGIDATTDDYWDELDLRMATYLPHRYKKAKEAPAEESAAPRRPRSVVTSSGRESSPSARPGEFRLSPERVRAIKEAGKWDDQVERQKMIRRYAEYDRSIGVR